MPQPKPQQGMVYSQGNVCTFVGSPSFLNFANGREAGMQHHLWQQLRRVIDRDRAERHWIRVALIGESTLYVVRNEGRRIVGA